MAKKRLSKHNTAIGLHHTVGSVSSPSVSIKGENLDADQIVKLAQRFGVPIVQKKELAQALKTLRLDENVPAELFEAIAIVIARIDSRIK